MSKQHCILCVDDEEQILNSLERMLMLKDYNVFTASSGSIGLEVLENNHIDLIIADQRMPEMNGSEFLRIAREKYPNTVRIMLSGYCDFEDLTKAINEGEIFRFISKPWNMEDLYRVVGDALNQNETVKVVGKLIKNVCEMTRFAESITVDECNESGSIIVDLVNNLNIIPKDNVNEFLTLLFDSLNMENGKQLKGLSGVMQKEEDTISICVGIGKGVTMKIRLPNV